MKTPVNANGTGEPPPVEVGSRSAGIGQIARIAKGIMPGGEAVTWSLCRQYWPFYGLVFLIGTENFIVSPFLPSMARDVGLPAAALATVVTAYALAYAVSAPVLGQFSDRLGSKPLITVGTIVFVAGNFCFALAPSLGLMQSARALTGLGGAAAGPAVWAFIAATAPADVRGRAMGLGMGAFALGQVAGLPVGGWVASTLGWRWAFAGMGWLLLPLLFAARSRPYPPPASRPNAPGGVRYPLLAVWRVPELSLAFGVTFLFHSGNLGAYTYLGSLLALQYGLSASQTGMVGILVGGGSFFGSFLGGKLNDAWRKKGGKGAYLSAVWALVLAFAILAGCSGISLAISLAAVGLWFVASGAFVTTQLASVTLPAPSMRATAVSWNNSIMFAGAGAGVSVIGLGTMSGVPIGWAGLAFGVAAGMGAVGLARFESSVQREKRP